MLATKNINPGSNESKLPKPVLALTACAFEKIAAYVLWEFI